MSANSWFSRHIPKFRATSVLN